MHMPTGYAQQLPGTVHDGSYGSRPMQHHWSTAKPLTPPTVTDDPMLDVPPAYGTHPHVLPGPGQYGMFDGHSALVQQLLLGMHVFDAEQYL